MKSFSELESVLRKVFTTQENISIELTKKDIDDWDSMGHLNLIVELEDTFGIKFSKQEIQSLDSIEKIFKKINSDL